MKFKLEEAYEIVFHRKPFFQQKSISDVYVSKVICEQAFGVNNADDKITPWSALEAKLYNVAGKTGAGPGEYSVAAAILKQNEPDLYRSLEAPVTSLETVISALQNYVQGGVVPYDIQYGDNRYEVKQATEISSVRTGTKAKDLAANIFLGLKEEINGLYQKYLELPSEYKNMLGKELGNVLTSSYEYLKAKNIELAQGAIFSVGGEYGLKSSARQATPKMYLLPKFFEEILTDPSIKDIISPTAEEIKKIYGVDLFDAKVIDVRAREYLSKRNKLEPGVESPETIFNDFLLMARLSSFADEEIFNKNIRDYFTPGTELHKQVLKTIFPETGLFIVSPQGYIYVGQERLDSFIRVTKISNGTLKIIPYRKTE
jgi:hypothetical protein